MIPSSKRFNNYTVVSDQVLEDAWKKVAQELATKPSPLATYVANVANMYPVEPWSKLELTFQRSLKKYLGIKRPPPSINTGRKS